MDGKEVPEERSRQDGLGGIPSVGVDLFTVVDKLGAAGVEKQSRVEVERKGLKSDLRRRYDGIYASAVSL